MKISSRLLSVAEKVKYKSVADIGTDHGYLPIYLLTAKKATHILATDINAGPLQRAESNILNSRLSDRIQTMLTDGLSNIPPGYDTCIITGMGGGLIINIIGQNLETAKSFKQLLLSPQRDVPDVRKYLHASGFRIDDEEIVKDAGKFYNILDCSTGQEPPYDKKGYVFGKILIEKRSSFLKELIDDGEKKAKRIICKLDAYSMRRQELEEYLEYCREVKECL